MSKTRYAIKHIPSNRFVDSDGDGELYLLDEDDSFTTFGKQTDANESLEFLKDYCDENGMLYFNDGEYTVDEFEVVEL
jgi:hypothetical protein